MLILLGFLPIGVQGELAGYSTVIAPTFFENTEITWDVIEKPILSVEWGWTGQGSWYIDEGEGISFIVERIIDDIEGLLRIGNFTVSTTNTDLARELVLGVWGLTPFFPGFVVPIGTENLNELNETAHASAERVLNNYLNGTMNSKYDQMTVSGETYDCIIFDYLQDETGFGVPQETFLAYDTATGILVSANTSVTFDNPYVLHIELSSVTRILGAGSILLGIVGVGTVVLVIVAVVLIKK